MLLEKINVFGFDGDITIILRYKRKGRARLNVNYFC